MPRNSFIPFDQDHPKFPESLRLEREPPRNDEIEDHCPIIQDAKICYKNILIERSREAFSGIFRHEDKEFRLIENMNPELLTSFFFDIRHSTSPSEYADIEPARLDEPETLKFFAVSCDYHNPEHVRIRTYSNSKNFDWSNQWQIDDLNRFRAAAFSEACGIPNFDEYGNLLWEEQFNVEIGDFSSEEQNQRKRKLDQFVETPEDGAGYGSQINSVAQDDRNSTGTAQIDLRWAALLLSPETHPGPHGFRTSLSPQQPPSIGNTAQQGHQPLRAQHYGSQNALPSSTTISQHPRFGMHQPSGNIYGPHYGLAPNNNTIHHPGFGMHQQRGQQLHHPFQGQNYGPRYSLTSSTIMSQYSGSRVHRQHDQ